MNRLKLFRVAKSRILLADDAATKFDLLLDGLSCSDKSWNMISLSRQLHKWWSESIFAIKCLGITPLSKGKSEIQLQFHWMPQAKRQEMSRAEAKAKVKADARKKTYEWRRKIDLAGSEGREFVNDWKEKTRNGTPKVLLSGGVVSAADAMSGRLLHSGRVIEISMDTEDAIKMKAMVDLQWACIQIASMSGAAGSPDFFTEPFPEDEDAEFFDAWYSGESNLHFASSEASPDRSHASSPDIAAEDMPIRPQTEPESHKTPPE